MSRYRILTDFDIDKIIDYVNEQEFINNASLYVSDLLIVEPFKRESSLRPILFEGRLIFFGELEEDNIKNIAFISLPDPASKMNVISILHMTIDECFIKNMIKFLKNYFKDSLYSKVRLSMYDRNYHKYLLDELLRNGFKCEADFSPLMNSKKLLGLKLCKEVE